ncbi:YolD-like family protein [Sporosarcina sp. resist]|uniref:YolD-like family protein n=1 Tax=Sporosarcina sp. resist TaxID=2762563 RepID=UPI00164CE428|nr:YolD-like family protein [Sporosarcina sp. resist]QNK87726.1 YolD-like family protein [Sporosarcina sp. resist]
MAAIPKPKDTKKSVAGPKLTEYDFLEIGEKISDALEFKNEVEITTYQRKQHEKFVGIVKDADGQKGVLTMQIGYEDIKINMNNIVSVK